MKNADDEISFMPFMVQRYPLRTNESLVTRAGHLKNNVKPRGGLVDEVLEIPGGGEKVT